MSSTEDRHPPEPTPPREASTLYESMLNSLGLGVAMLYPEPNATGEAHVGDVGVFVGGRFVRLLNVDATPGAKRVTHWEPPYEHAEHLQLSIDSRSACLAAARHAARRVLAIEVGDYKREDVARVSLHLQSPAHSESLYDSRTTDQYILKHVRSWHGYAKQVTGRDVALEHIMFVAGVVKTTADWAIALEGPGADGQWAVRREGRHYASRPRVGMPVDQCVFVRCKAVVRSRAPFWPLRVVEAKEIVGLVEQGESDTKPGS
ncbi:hypothetical protein PsYK624_104470 [Phanerochaete sordida]|uniref:Uncharacterized protein n=1 Tax=Phanerochaete sordida TaxID=48140 RepID=A0A9P3GDV7_9APHY|nr:hypothetical protein PsYK624_104470 [Phanerochaete sordida]